jgi:ATP-GRASP peptide maturase of grasp-with-spasm system
MIVLLSSEGFEITTDDVIDWLDSLGGDWVRFNGEDLTGQGSYEFRLDLSGSTGIFTLGNREVRNEDVGVVWFRRWHKMRDFPIPGVQSPLLQKSVERHLGRELRALTEALYLLFEHAHWLTSPSETKLSKLHMLRLASNSGLAVPATAVINRKGSLQRFKDIYGRIITKSVGEVDVFYYANHSWGLYTAELTQADVDAAPEIFFPTLVQERLEKAFEVRTFFLSGAFYSMAIFSQTDAKTQEDFRRYNLKRPNRNVPYCLPPETTEALREFVRAAGLSTGSIDLIRTPDGRHVFLEVNPGGQFGMVSRPCNYHLERRVAEHLIGLDHRDCGGARQPCRYLPT